MSVPLVKTVAVAEAPFPVLLREVHVGGKTGLLHLERPAGSLRLRFVGGELLSGECPGHGLDRTLARHGLLSAFEIARAATNSRRERTSLATALRDTGILSDWAVDAAVALHRIDLLHLALSCEGTRCSFEAAEAPCPLGEYPDPRLPTSRMIVEALHTAPPQAVRRGLGDLDSVPRRSQLSRRMSLLADERQALDRIDGRASCLDLIDGAPVEPHRVERALLSLFCTGLIAMSAPSSPAGNARKLLAVEVDRPHAAQSASLFAQAQACKDQGLRQHAAEVLRELLRIDPENVRAREELRFLPCSHPLSGGLQCV